ncbi:hypothetical protein BH11PLA2_BH11PLA2_08270 [soil metagenome]
MNRFRWPLLLILICLPLVWLAAGFALPWKREAPVTPARVPDGDYELAWFNTTTGGTTWDRFVVGVQRLEQSLPGATVVTSHAYPASTNAVPEVVVSMKGQTGSIRIRWYKLSNEQTIHHWLDALSQRTPAPLAVIAGSSSDRARDFALALEQRKTWKGARPLFCITNATAIDVAAASDAPQSTVPLLSIYPGRSFRFCFNNRQMAEAMLDFVWQHPDLCPGSLKKPLALRPTVCRMAWRDDPYSEDMVDQVGFALQRKFGNRPESEQPREFRWQVPYSIGGFNSPNEPEAAAADSMLKVLREQDPQRSLLVIPTVTAPARRILMRICEENSEVGRRLVALNGDGMGVNAVLRDGDVNWPLASIPVPLVLFAHNNPAAWDSTMPAPNSTDDILNAEDMIRLLTVTIFDLQATAKPVNADELATRMLPANAFFEADGNRKDNNGEFMFVLRPAPVDGSHRAGIEVWRRLANKSWDQVLKRSLPLTNGGRP